MILDLWRVYFSKLSHGGDAAQLACGLNGYYGGLLEPPLKVRMTVFHIFFWVLLCVKGRIYCVDKIALAKPSYVLRLVTDARTAPRKPAAYLIYTSTAYSW